MDEGVCVCGEGIDGLSATAAHLLASIVYIQLKMTVGFVPPWYPINILSGEALHP